MRFARIRVVGPGARIAQAVGMRCLLSALVLLGTTAHAYELKRDSAGDPAAWKSAVHFVVDPDLDAKLQAPGATDAVRAALKTMNAAVPQLTIDATPGTPHSVGYDFDHPELSTSDISAPAEWKWNVDAVATTVITLSRSNHQILEADIAFNIAHTEFEVVQGDSEHARYDVQNAMTHELGHAFGLAHNAIPHTVMYPASQPGEISKRTFAPDDLDGLGFLYPAKPITPVTEEERVRGCSATTSAPIALGLMLVVLARRRRALLKVAAMLGLVMAVVPAVAASRVDPRWTAAQVKTLAPMPGQRVLETEVTWVRDGEVHTVRVPGGRWGDLEQIVDGASVPVEGETR